jgi:Leucine-rich repeat (LRR) protein
MKKFIPLVIIATIIITIIPIISANALPPGGYFGERNITDEKLAEMVASGEIPANSQSLNLEGNQISDLTPLSELTDLHTLYLHNNQINDLTPLSGLKNLEMLWLINNQIDDITPLNGLTNLVFLDLTRNQITDLTPLNRLTNLYDLNLSINQINNLTPLSNMTSLRRLELRHTKRSTPWYLSISSLYIDSQRVR